MRTKTLLLTAALSAAGLLYATAQEPVFSVNAVGYVKKTVPPGEFALLSNPLNATGEDGNSLDAVLPDAPGDTQVFEFNPETGGFSSYTKRDLGPDDQFWSGTGAEEARLNPGEGFYIRNAGEEDLEVTFVGEVPQGQLSTAFSSGFTLLGSPVPQEGALENQLGLPAGDGDQVFIFEAGSFASFTRRGEDFGNIWTGGDGEPVLEVAQGFFFSTDEAGTWERDFNVNDNE